MADERPFSVLHPPFRLHSMLSFHVSESKPEYNVNGEYVEVSEEPRDDEADYVRKRATLFHFITSGQGSEMKWVRAHRIDDMK